MKQLKSKSHKETALILCFIFGLVLLFNTHHYADVQQETTPFIFDQRIDAVRNKLLIKHFMNNSLIIYDINVDNGSNDYNYYYTFE